eukprot:SAG11_NODE_1065_length_5989_cov_103.088285_2_plen_198_part_00
MVAQNPPISLYCPHPSQPRRAADCRRRLGSTQRTGTAPSPRQAASRSSRLRAPTCSRPTLALTRHSATAAALPHRSTAAKCDSLDRRSHPCPILDCRRHHPIFRDGPSTSWHRCQPTSQLAPICSHLSQRFTPRLRYKPSSIEPLATAPRWWRQQRHRDGGDSSGSASTDSPSPLYGLHMSPSRRPPNGAEPAPLGQ